MIGNATDLETSKRLAAVWPFAKSPIDDVWFWAVSPKGGKYLRKGVAGRRPDGVWHDTFDGCLVYPARTLSELEAKIREMGWAVKASIQRCPWQYPKDKWHPEVFVELRGAVSAYVSHSVARKRADTTIDALGAAVAEALEKTGEGGKA